MTERRAGMDEILERVTRVETKLDEHISLEDRDRREHHETLACIKKQVTDIRLELAEYRGKVGIAGVIIGVLVAAASTAVAWFKG